jgi:hypothetical protein
LCCNGIKHEYTEHSTTCSFCLWNQQGGKYNPRIS